MYGCLIFLMFSPFVGCELEHLSLAFSGTQGFLFYCTNLQYLIWGVNSKDGVQSATLFFLSLDRTHHEIF